MIRLRAENAKNRHGRSVAVEGTLGAVKERRWAARRSPDPVGRRAWSISCFIGTAAQSATSTSRGQGPASAPAADGTVTKLPARLFHDLRRSGRAQHGPGWRPRARGDAGERAQDAERFRPLQDRERGRSAGRDAADDGLRGERPGDRHCGPDRR